LILPVTSSTNLNILFESLLFLVAATLFLLLVGWAWRHLQPFSLPQPLPAWFKGWFLTVQVVGGVVPLAAMVLWRGDDRVLAVFVTYFAVLSWQVLSEVVALRWFHSVVWVMIPYLYVLYRLLQLYQGLMLLPPQPELRGVRNLLLIEIVLWIISYGLALAQLPRLFRWELKPKSDEQDSQNFPAKTHNASSKFPN